MMMYDIILVISISEILQRPLPGREGSLQEKSPTTQRHTNAISGTKDGLRVATDTKDPISGNAITIIISMVMRIMSSILNTFQSFWIDTHSKQGKSITPLSYHLQQTAEMTSTSLAQSVRIKSNLNHIYNETEQTRQLKVVVVRRSTLALLSLMVGSLWL